MACSFVGSKGIYVCDGLTVVCCRKFHQFAWPVIRIHISWTLNSFHIHIFRKVTQGLPIHTIWLTFTLTCYDNDNNIRQPQTRTHTHTLTNEESTGSAQRDNILCHMVLIYSNVLGRNSLCSVGANDGDGNDDDVCMRVHRIRTCSKSNLTEIFHV